jgi:ABC-type multidrug transport system fused ATPase/permease subunit
MFIPAVLPSVALFAYFSGRAIRKYSKKAQRHVAESNTIVEETLQGIQNVIAFTNELFEINRYRERTNEVALIVPSRDGKSTIVSLLLNSMN